VAGSDVVGGDAAGGDAASSDVAGGDAAGSGVAGDDAAGERAAAVPLEVAAQIRARGDRPGIPALRTAVEAARTSVTGLATRPLPDPAVAAALAAAALRASSDAVPLQHDGA